jgi:hypothetical protein
MSFKLWSTLYPILFMMLSCSKGQSNPKAAINIRLAVGNTDCFNGIGDQVRRFLEGGSSPEAVHSTFACVTQIVNDFSRITIGSQSDRYSKNELRSFLERYYFKSGLPDELIVSTLDLKVLLVGGNNSEVTRDEINELLLDVETIERNLVQILPQMPLILGASQATDERWDEAFHELTTFAQNLSEIFSQQQGYQFASLQSFISNWAKYYNFPIGHWVRRLADLIPVFAKGKVLLVGGNNQTIAAAEWAPLFQTLAEGYSAYRLKSRLASRHADPSGILSEPKLLSVADQLLAIVDRAVSARPQKLIVAAEFQDFFASLELEKILPASLGAKQLTTILSFVTDRLLRAPGAALGALDEAGVNELKSLIARWRSLAEAFSRGDLSVYPEFDSSVHANFNLQFDESGRLTLPATGSRVNFEFPLFYVALEWLGQRWSAWPMNADPFHSMVTDIVSVAHGVGMIASISDSIYLRLLQESNLFMPSSNGDMKLDLKEAFQYSVILLSAFRGAFALEQASKTGCSSDNVKCFNGVLFAKRSDLLRQFPKLLNWMGTDVQRFSEFDAKLSGTVGEGQWVQQFVLIHYVETFNLRFDLNHDSVIDFAEATNAYVIYGPILSQMLSNVGFPSEETWPLYTFLFKYGATPLTLFGGAVRYLYWRWNEKSWYLAADRQVLIGILSELSKL